MIIARTPLRISFFGGGTDFPTYFSRFGGAILGTAIDKFTYAIVVPRFDNKICVGYTKQELVDSVDEIQHDLVRECAKLVGMTSGWEVKTLSDIPSEGSGLGSSSSITISLLNAFHTYLGYQIPLSQLADEAIEIELGKLNKPIGIQDQLLCAIGGTRLIYIDKKEILSYPDNQLIKEEKNLHLFYTGITRKSEDILQDQSNNIEKNLDVLNEIKNLAFSKQPFVTKLQKAWEYKKQLSSLINTPEIQNMINLAYDNGAKAWKILGAGGGGFLLVYIEPEDYSSVSNALKEYKELQFKFEPFGSKIIFNAR